MSTRIMFRGSMDREGEESGNLDGEKGGRCSRKAAGQGGTFF